MKTTATNRKLRVLLSAMRNGSLIPQPGFQRRLVWANKHKIAFLKTILEDYPFPEIYIAAGEVNPQTAEGTEMLVDGQQRLTTILQYFLGSSELQLDGELTAYQSLSEEQKRKFLEYEVVVRDLGAVPIELIKEVFRRINSTNYSLKAMEIHNARFEGELKNFAEDLSSSEFFERHRIFTATDIKRMQDVAYVLTIIATLLSTYFSDDDELETYLEKYNDEFEQKEQIRAEMTEVFSFVERCDFSETSRAWKKADFFTLFVELHRALFKEHLSITPNAVAIAVKAFYAKVDDNAARASDDDAAIYQTAAVQGSNSRSRRIRRGEIIQSILQNSAATQTLFPEPSTN